MMARLIDFRPTPFSIRPGLQDFGEGIEHMNEMRHKRRLADLEETRANDARAYNQKQMSHLDFLEGEKRGETGRLVEDRRREAMLRMAEARTAGKGAAAEIEARSLGGRIEPTEAGPAAGGLRRFLKPPAPPTGPAAPLPEPEIREPDFANRDALRGVQQELGEFDLPGMRKLGDRVGERADMADEQARAVTEDDLFPENPPAEAPIAQPPQIAQPTPQQAEEPMGLSGMMKKGFRFIGPNGEVLDIDPDEQMNVEKERRTAEADEWISQLGEMGPQETEAARRVRAAIVSGTSTKGQAMADFNNTTAQLRSQGFQAEQQAKYEMTAKQKYNIGMRPRGGGVNIEGRGLTNDKKRLDIEQEYIEPVEKMIAKKQLGGMYKDQRKAMELADTIAGADDNGALAAMTAGAFTKLAQGGTGVVSDNDLKVFWQTMGGLGIRTRQAFEDAWSGKLTPEKQKMVQDAIATLQQSMNKHTMEFGADIERALDPIPGAYDSAVPGKPSRMERAIGMYAAPYLETWRAKRANAGDKGAQDALEAEADDVLSRRRK